jgi:hypothetical protein
VACLFSTKPSSPLLHTLMSPAADDDSSMSLSQCAIPVILPVWLLLIHAVSFVSTSWNPMSEYRVVSFSEE